MKVFFVLFLFLSTAAYADVLSLEAGAEKLADVPLAKKGTVKVEGSVPVARLGYGLRKKKVAFISVKVYVAQLFGSDEKSYARSEDKALASLAAMKASAIQMNFLHDVSADKLSSAFEDSFEERGLDKDPAISKFLEAVKSSGDVADGEIIRIAAQKLADGKEEVAYEDPKGKVTTVTGASGFIQNVFSLWLGKTDEGTLEDLRAALISGKWE